MVCPSIFIYPTRSSLVELVSRYFIKRVSLLLDELDQELKLNIALAGGSIISEIYNYTSTLETFHTLNDERINFFWSDERYVEHKSKDRNCNKITNFIDRLTKPSFFRMGCSRCYDTVESSAKDYNRKILNNVRLDKNNKPVFDILFLGMGNDGHIASLFPNLFSLNNDSSVIPIKNNENEFKDRLSLTVETINNAEEVWLVASGEEKSSVFADAIDQKRAVLDLPASAARGKRSIWFVDKECAKDI